MNEILSIICPFLSVPFIWMFPERVHCDHGELKAAVLVGPLMWCSPSYTCSKRKSSRNSVKLQLIRFSAHGVVKQAI